MLFIWHSLVGFLLILNDLKTKNTFKNILGWNRRKNKHIQAQSNLRYSNNWLRILLELSFTRTSAEIRQIIRNIVRTCQASVLKERSSKIFHFSSSFIIIRQWIFWSKTFILIRGLSFFGEPNLYNFYLVSKRKISCFNSHL